MAPPPGTILQSYEAAARELAERLERDRRVISERLAVKVRGYELLFREWRSDPPAQAERFKAYSRFNELRRVCLEALDWRHR